MEIEILKENLEKAVSITSKVSNKNLSLPVLGCVVFSVEAGKALVRATNLDVSVEVSLKAKIQKNGIVAVPAHILSATISSFSDQKLVLKVSGNVLSIKGERGTTAITTVDATEFPTLPYVKEGKGVSVPIPSRDFIALMRSAVFAASNSTVKPELASVSLSFDGMNLIAVATDSFRLAEVKVPLKVKGSFSQVLLPARNMADIIRAIESEDTIEMRVGENQCSFVTSVGHITSRTIDGAFPDYQQVIPKDSVASATCLKEDAVSAFKKVAIFTDSYNHVHIAVKPSEKLFSVNALNTSVGETTDKIPGTVEGEDIEINFNARYITDALPVVSGDSVKFSIAGPGRPMVITDVPHKHFTYLVMPMNR